MTLTRRVEAWRKRGGYEKFQGRRIFVSETPGAGTPLLFLHGFPSSSYDWREVLDLFGGRPTLAFDFLGFGLSEKPPDHYYGLAWQADLSEELVRRHVSGPVFVAAHDMGTSVATELMARQIEGSLGIELAGVFLFNGSMILERASPTLGQKLLRGPAGPLAARLTSKRFFLHQFGSIFSEGHPIDPEEAADQWSLLTYSGGHRIGHRLIAYMDERVKYAKRWHGAIRDWPGRLSFAWGMQDPVATPNVLEGLRELRPTAPVQELPSLGHYPQIEDPPALQAALQRALDTSV
jgi:pimeloyl-ACP methyl ester carboxylesterase